MTCVVGWLDGRSGKVHMGVDSAGTSWNSIRTRKDPKLFRVEAKSARGRIADTFLVGCCGSFRLMQLLQFHLELPARPKTQDPYEYMVREFIPAVRKATAEGGFQKAKAGQESIDDASFLVGFAGRLFLVASDFQVEERDEPFNATGSGEFYALGALYILGDQELPPENRLTRALEAATYYNPNVRGPFAFDYL